MVEIRDEKKIMNTLNYHFNYVKDLGYNVFGTYLQGSQNYDLDYENSDIDTKTIIIPSIDDIVLNRNPVSTTIELPNKEHIDIKDIRIMFSTFLKQNINFLEILFTKYYIISYGYGKYCGELFGMADDIANINNNQLLRCMVGMSMEKLKALEHPYPSIVDKIEKFEYDGKQLSHIVRMNDFISRLCGGESFRNCLIYPNREYMISLKKSSISLDEARILSKEMDESTRKIQKENCAEKDYVNVETINRMNKLLSEIIKYSFKSELSLTD